MNSAPQNLQNGVGKTNSNYYRRVRKQKRRTKRTKLALTKRQCMTT